MANAQLAEEELQQSVVVSEEDTMEGDDATVSAPMAGREQAEENNPHAIPNVQARHESLQDDSGKEAEMPALPSPPELQSERKQRFEGEVSIEGANEEMEEEQGEEEDEEEDAEGEPDNRVFFGEDPYQEASASQLNEETAGNGSGSGSGGFSAEGSDDEDEGVGAVKIQPGATDDEDEDAEEEPETTNSLSPSDTEDSEIAAWEDAPEGEDDNEESEVADSSVCMFCKQDEEHDPGEDFEEILECSTCGENAHRYCAREANVLGREPNMSQWKCPHCVSQAGNQRTESADDADQGENEGKAAALPASTRSSSQLIETAVLVDGANSPNTPTLPAANEELTESSRLLRKRKPSTYTDVADSTILRKRRRRTSNDGDWSLGSPQQAEQNQSTTDQPRRLRLKTSSEDYEVTIIKKQHSLVVRFHVEPSSLRRIMSQQGIVSRKRASRTPISRTPRTGVPSLAAPFMASATQPFYSFLDRETDEMKAKPYGGILAAAEADTSKTLPTNEDRRRFDEAKQKAEEEWRSIHAIEWNPEASEKTKKYRKTNGPASQIECIEFGGWEIDTWYAAPYPEEYSRNRILYICEFCLKYMNSDYVSWRHKLKCPAKHPPGDEIYRHGSVSMFEVDGRKNPVYCQNLCLLAKLFLGSKTLYYDVEPFLFYVLCEYNELGYHFVGYFSKEKRASSQNNVSCILTLPTHQRKGYGNLLIDFSYLLTRVEQKTGSPEKPLSDMGLVSYRNYWRLVMCQYLLGSWKGAKESKVAAGLSIRQISEDTGLTPDDVVSALEGLRCLARDPVSGLYAFRVDLAYCQEYMSKWEGKEYVKLHPDALTWTPYVMGRGNATNFELGPAITAIAPREEDEDRKVMNGGGLNAHAKRNSQPGDPGLPHDLTDRMFGGDEQPGKLDSPYKNLQPGCNTTEPNDAGMQIGAGHEGAYSDIFREDSHNPDVKSDSWDTSYKNLPVARFEVFPPPGGRRSDRTRPSVPRPPALRTSSHNPRPKRSSGSSSVRRSTTSRPGTGGSSRRKSGGTGRGPGRWPKGTKKSDYGNASSGPGLPPGWIRDREKVTTSKSSMANGTISADDAEASQEIKVQHLGSVSATGADKSRATEATQYGNRNANDFGGKFTEE